MLGQGLGTIAPWSTKYPNNGVGGSNNNGRKWFKHLTEVNSDEDSEGAGQSNSSGNGDQGTLAGGDRINSWGGHDGTDINWGQETSADKPTYDGTEKTACAFNGNQFFDASSDMAIGGSSDFAIVVRFKCTNFDSARAIMGDTSNEHIMLTNNQTISVKINGTNRNFQETGETVLATDQYYTLIIVRKNDSMTTHIKGGAFTNDTLWGAEIASAAGDITISNLGAAADDTNNFVGFITDTIIYTTNDGGLSRESNRVALHYAIENKY